MLDQSFKISRSASWFIILSILVVTLIYFRSLIEPFVLSLFIWYLISATKRAIARISIRGWSAPPWLASTLAFLLTFSILWAVFEIISFNVNLIIQKSPAYTENVQGMVNALGSVPFLDRLPMVDDVDKFILDNLGNLDLRTYIGSVINSLSSIVGNLALIVVYVIFLLIEENFIPLKIDRIFRDPERRNTVQLILDHIGLSINKYFFVKTSMSLLTGVLSYLLLLVFGVDFAVLWAFLIFLF
ncbi:MAG: AI-2E family transporter, partial [Bacteroidota bacterium]